MLVGIGYPWSDIVEEEPMPAFSSLSERLTATFAHLRGKGRLTAADIDSTVREIRRALLDADVALEVVKAFTAAIRTRALGKEVSEALNPAQQVVKIVDEELVSVLGGSTRRLHLAKVPPTVILLAGLQGAGKTTLAGKLGRALAAEGHTPLLAACDLQRPDAVTQLRVIGEQAGVPVFAPEPGNGVGDPVRVARDAVVEAGAKQYDVVIVDTAGRLGVDAELMDQAKRIREAVQPDEVLFVIDAMTGQDAAATARAFRDGVGLTGVVLSKLDGDTRGGAALSVVSVTGAPILYASTGEGLDDFEVFHPDRMSRRILDMGDVLSLIEEAQRHFDEEQARAAAEKIAKDQFTLDDFLTQLQQIKGSGALQKMLQMMPGAGQMRQAISQIDDREIARTEAIIQSMTPAERQNAKLINGSRRLRIAKGSGTTVEKVNQLLKRFEDASKMMRKMSHGGMPQVPGMPAIGHGGRKSVRKAAKQKRGRSGNPAKRAAQEARLREQHSGPATGSSFGGSPDLDALKDLPGLGGLFRQD
jgi:signal recognition particle subunit SRP54